MIMCSQHSIHLLERKWIDNERYIAQIRLHRTAAAHVRHLVTNFHLAIPVRTLAVTAPKIHRNIRSTRRLEPGTCAPQPPHSNLSGRNLIALDILYQPSF